MNRFALSRMWWLALGAPLAAWALGERPVTFDAPLRAGEKLVLTGSVVTLGQGVVLAPGATLSVRAADSVVFSPGIDFAGGVLDMHVGPEASAKPTALVKPVEAFTVSVGHASTGIVVRYAVPKEGQLTLRVLDLQGKTMFKTSWRARSAGRQEKVVAFVPRYGGLYLVRAEFAGETVQQRAFLGSR